jgi:site-specific DNA-methyltransferase (adenine-specific)
MIDLLGWDCLVLVGDCRRWLPEISAGSVQLTITDPPYESLERHRAVGTTTRLKESKSSSNQWFECFPNQDYFLLLAELYQAHARNSHCYIFCDSETEHVILSGRNPYDRRLDEALVQGPLTPRGQWTAWPTLSWIKTKRSSDMREVEALVDDDLHAGMGYHWRRACERILFLEKGKRKLNNLGWPDVFPGPKAGRSDFPTQKPLSVLHRLVENSSVKDEVVLDPFAGSGATALAALELGRRVILIEKNPSDWLKQNLANLTNTGKHVVWQG